MRSELLSTAAVAVLVAACGTDSTSNSRQEAAISAPVSADPQPIDGCDYAMDEIGESESWGYVTFFGVTNVTPGSDVALDWEVRIDGTRRLRSDTTIECWTTDGWVAAWGVADVYTEPHLVAVRAVTQDWVAVPRTQGSVPVPAWAQPGSYRVTEPIEICSTDEDSCATYSSEARFTVG